MGGGRLADVPVHQVSAVGARPLLVLQQHRRGRSIVIVVWPRPPRRPRRGRRGLPGRVPPSRFRDKNRRDIGKSKSKLTAS
jgi:hypothetical protein